MTSDEFSDWYDRLFILTYGEIDDEYIFDSFKTILQWKKDSIFISDQIPDNKFTVNEYWLLLSLLHECIEYGTSPRGAWLTYLGEQVLRYLHTIQRNHNE